jgi:hypothetical protein
MARITVASDDPGLVQMVRDAPDEIADHEVTELGASATPIADLDRPPPDLLIVDLNGANDTRSMVDRMLRDRAAAALGMVPMIVCSADVRGLRAWADEFADLGNVYGLERPISLGSFTDLIERALYRAALSPARVPDDGRYADIPLPHPHPSSR